MKKIIALVLATIMSFSVFAIGASAADMDVPRGKTIESGTLFQPGDIITFTGTKSIQVSYRGGSISAYEIAYNGICAEGYEYFQDFTQNVPGRTGFAVPDIGTTSTGYMILEGVLTEKSNVPIEFSIEHAKFTGWKVTTCENGSSKFTVAFEATWEEDAANPFPKPEPPKLSILETIINYLKQAVTFLMKILSEAVKKIMEFLGINKPADPVVSTTAAAAL